MFYFFVFLVSFILSVLLSLIIRKVALKYKIVDVPNLGRKIHKKEIPLLGGIAIFLSFFGVLFFVQDKILAGELEMTHWMGFFLGSVFLMIGGFLDDKYNLKPSQQIFWPILAIVCVILGGVGIAKITNPLGGLIYFDKFILFSEIFTFIWLLGMMYTTKLLDGVDGLVTGVAGIGGLIIFLFTLTTKYYQPDMALASLIFAATCFGFLVFNWHPAKIFLGEGGSLLLGFILGVLAIISGGKIAIALLVMGIPVLDVIWTVIRRLFAGKNPFNFADDKHLHHRLLNLGIGQRKTVLIFYFLALLFGLSGLFLQSKGKVLALGIIFIIMVSLVLSLNLIDKRKNNEKI